MNKKIKIALLPLLILLLAFLCHFLRYSHTSKNNGYQDNVRIYLWNNKNATEKEQAEDLKILRNRLDQLFHDDYDLEENENNMVLTYKKSNQGGLATYEFLEDFLLEPEEYNIAFQQDSTYKTICYLKKSDYISVEKADTSRLKITFSREAGDAMLSYRDAGVDLYLQDTNLYHDYETNAAYNNGYLLQPDSSDPYVYYINANEEEFLDNSLCDMLIYNLKNEGLHYPYNYKIANSDTTWQDISDYPIIGMNQCNEEDLVTDYYIIDFSLSHRLTNDEFKNMESILKNRLDALDSKYAFGSNANKSFSIKITPEHLNETLIQTLTNNNFIQLYYNGNKIYLSGQEGDNTFEYDSSKPALKILFGNEQEMKKILSDPGHTVYLSMDNYIFSSMNLTEAFNSDELTFKEFDLNSDSGTDLSWYYNYLGTIFNDSFDGFSFSISLEDYYYEDLSHYLDCSHFGLAYSEKYYNKTDIEQRIKEIYPEATLDYSMGNGTINVRLHHDTDEYLLSDTLPKVQEIFESIDFKNSGFSNIYFYLYDPKLDERSWLIFAKSDTGIEFSDVFYNGRSENYKDELSNLIEKYLCHIF